MEKEDTPLVMKIRDNKPPNYEGKGESVNNDEKNAVVFGPSNASLLYAAMVATMTAIFVIVGYATISSWRYPSLLLLGFFIGFTFKQSAFGFSDNFRIFLMTGRGSGVRWHWYMILLAGTIMAPIIHFNKDIDGYVPPVSVSVVVGSFLFGVGMQLADCCASGSMIYIGTIPETPLPFLILFGFTFGATYGMYRREAWMDFPNATGIGIVTEKSGIQWQEGIVLNMFLCLGLVAISYLIESYIYGKKDVQHDRYPPLRLPRQRVWWRKVLFGRWPWIVGCPLLMVFSVFWLVFNQSTWSVVAGYAMMGSKLLYALGVPVDTWGIYANSPSSLHFLKYEPLYNHGTWMSDVGMVLGAMTSYFLTRDVERLTFRADRCYSCLRNTRRSPLCPSWMGESRMFLLRWLAIDWKRGFGALFGSFLMGYGAITAYGCNIGAYYSISTSMGMAGWVWLICAWIGCFVGIQFRPLLNLRVEGPLGTDPYSHELVSLKKLNVERNWKDLCPVSCAGYDAGEDVEEKAD